jgi:hypothetical protein
VIAFCNSFTLPSQACRILRRLANTEGRFVTYGAGEPMRRARLALAPVAWLVRLTFELPGPSSFVGRPLTAL